MDSESAPSFTPDNDDALTPYLPPLGSNELLKERARELRKIYRDPYKCLLKLSMEFFSSHPVYTHYYVGGNLFQCDVDIGEYTFRTTRAKQHLLKIENDAACIALDHLCGDSDLYTLPLLTPPSTFVETHLVESYPMALDWLCELNGLGSAEYRTTGSPSAREWKCRVSIIDRDAIYSEVEYGEPFSSRDEAQEDAAKRMFEALTRSV